MQEEYDLLTTKDIDDITDENIRILRNILKSDYYASIKISAITVLDKLLQLERWRIIDKEEEEKEKDKPTLATPRSGARYGRSS